MPWMVPWSPRRTAFEYLGHGCASRANKKPPFRSYRSFWRHSFQLRGRTGRREYFFAIAMQTLITAGASLGGIALVFSLYNYWNIPADAFRGVQYTVDQIVFYVVIFPSFIPMFSLMTRRTRDSGLPPLLAVFSLIPGIGYIGMLILYSLPSKTHTKHLR